MIRNRHPQDDLSEHAESELVRLCRAKQWDSVATRSCSHPSEAIPNYSRNNVNHHHHDHHHHYHYHHEGMEGPTTALSIATRHRAPVHVMEQLIQAHVAQVGVTHSVKGSVLHVALKHRATDEILELLVKAVIHFDATMNRRQGDSILGELDELGRTPLHYMVDRILRALDRGERSTNSWNILRLMVESYPDAISVIDADGTTPLVLLLLIPKFASCGSGGGGGGPGYDLEDDVYCIVQLMLSLSPKAVQVSRRLPRPWHYHFHYDNDDDVNFDDDDKQEELLVHGDGVPSPLSCALLHGRSVPTIELLLDANRKMGVHACRSLVTHYREVPLHIVASMRCRPDLLERLVQEDRVALGVSDIYGLKPIDWIWIRHTLDWCSATDPFAPIMVSRRRYVHNHFLDWYRKVSNQYLGVDHSMDESPNPQVREWSKRLKTDLFQRMCIVLPEMACLKWKQWYGRNEVDGASDIVDADSRFSLVYAAAFVTCPLAMVKLACDSFPEDLRTLDARMGRLPLHYAATRGGYAAQFPVGASCHIQHIQEVSPLQTILARFPAASRVTDSRGQLALHIAVDYVKDAKMKQRRRGSCGRRACTTRDDQDHENDTVSQSSGSSSCSRMEQPGHQEIGALLSFNPESLYRRDGITKLYPFQQAAEGTDGDLELSYMLLRHDPSLVQSIHFGYGGRNESRLLWRK